MFEFKEGENCNRRNTFKYLEDYNLRLTLKSGKLAICGWALNSATQYGTFKNGGLGASRFKAVADTVDFMPH